MRYNTIFLAALSLECALAQPAHHRHHHKQRRDLKDVDWTKVHYDVDWTKVKYGGASPTTTVAGSAPTTSTTATSDPTTNPVDQSQDQSQGKPISDQNMKAKAPKIVNVVPVPADTSNTDSSGSQFSGGSSGSGIVQGATGGAQGSFGGRTAGRQSGDKDLYIGNVGVPFGSNMMLVDTQTAQQQYKYTITFKNTGSSDIKVIVWQNPGRDGSPLGGKGEDPIISIPLSGGESQAVAFDEDTHGAFSLDCARDNYDTSTTCARGEYNFGDQCPKEWDNQNGSQGWSGFDRSTIAGGKNDNLSMSCLNCGSGGPQTSAKGKNEFVTGAQQSAGGAIYPGPAHILAEMSA